MFQMFLTVSAWNPLRSIQKVRLFHEHKCKVFKLIYVATKLDQDSFENCIYNAPSRWFIYIPYLTFIKTKPFFCKIQRLEDVEPNDSYERRAEAESYKTLRYLLDLGSLHLLNLLLLSSSQQVRAEQRCVWSGHFGTL